VSGDIASVPRRPRGRPPALRSAIAICSLALLGGCGGSGGAGSTSGASVPPETTSTNPPKVIVQTASPGFDAAGVFKQAAPGVVTIRSVFGTSGDGSLGSGASAAEGSGFVLDAEGEIVTNAHVVTDGNGADRKVADQVFVEFPDRNVVDAEVVGYDPFYDVALLKVDPKGLAPLHPLELGDDKELVVGEPVAAIGSPFGELQSLSVGVVSAIDRSVKSLTQFQIEGAIQTDASINPGNSGGPLLDPQARVIGINQQIETASGANDGVGFAVPISAIRRSIAQLRDGGVAEYAYIGVSSQSLYPQLAEKLGIDSPFGGLIADVVPGGPADEAGLKGSPAPDDPPEITFQASGVDTGGDVILSVDGKKVTRPEDLALLIAAKKPGQKVTVGILRDGNQKMDVEVTLDSRPGGPGSG